MHNRGDDGHSRQGSVVTIGNFDGVHLGHRRLIEIGQAEARREGGNLVAVTFDPHPRTVLSQDHTTAFLITNTEEKRELLMEAGVSVVDVLPFTPEFSQMAPEVFLHKELGERLKARAVVVGNNFSFGRGGEGTPRLLRHWGEENGVKVVISESVYDASGQPISSSRIRAAIARGDLLEAERLMGRPFQVRTVVVSGAGRGRQMGIPTANLAVAREHVMPPLGVYAGYVRTASGETSAAVASWGLRPTFGDLKEPLLEVHLIDVSRALAGMPIWFAFTQYIRDEVHFNRIEDLVQQMEQDVAVARTWYQARSSG